MCGNAILSRNTIVLMFLRIMCGDQLFSQPPLPEIPNELITEILLRLPVKSLVRFRCVCKHWNSIISDTHFAKLHLSRSTMDPTLNHHHLLLFKQTTCQLNFLSCSVKSLFNNPFAPPLDDLTCNFRPDNYMLHIFLGTCNGVVCLFDAEKNHLLLCNPSTRLTSRKYPLRDYTLDWTMFYHGFGYDHVSDQFKAVFVFHNPTPQDVNGTITKVYTFGDNCWTTIQNLNYLGYGYPTKESGVFVDGTLNWVALRKGVQAGVPYHVIRSFNLENETFSELSLPDFAHYNRANPMQAVLKNCLSVCYDWKGTHLVVWLMKEYGVKESWTKLMAIPHVEPQTFGNPDIQPFCMSETGQILLNSISNSVRTIIYNSKDGRLEYPTFRSDVIWYTQHFYVESLVSPCF